MKKLHMAIMAIALVSSLAFANEVLATKAMPVYPDIYDYNNDYPETLVLKGVAVKNSKAVSAVLLAVDKDEKQFEYKNYYLLIGGKAVELNTDSINFDKKTGTLIAKFSSDEGELKLVLKHYRINYYNTILASGEFGDYLLNMKLVGSDDQIYRILEPLATQEAMEVATQVAEIVE